VTRRGVQRLLALILALGILSIAPTVATNLAAGRSSAPTWWTALVCLAYLAVFVLLLVQAGRRASCWVPAWSLVAIGNLALATYPLVAADVDDDVPWVLAVSSLTIGAGAVVVPRLWGALALTVVHLLVRFALQASGVWVVARDIAVLEAVGLVVVSTAVSLAAQALDDAGRQVEQARAEADRAAAAAAAARAVEAENSRWDGIVHDDVLASLSMTAHVREGQDGLADREQARQAAARALANIDRDLGEATAEVPLVDAVIGLRGTVLDLLPSTVLTLPPRTEGGITFEAAEALTSATVEAIRNSLRHGVSPGAGAPAVRVRVRVAAERLSVEVRDDGVGFDTRRATPRLGLAVSVRRRADVVGGRARVRSVPGVGTIVLLSVPLSPVQVPV